MNVDKFVFSAENLQLGRLILWSGKIDL